MESPDALSPADFADEDSTLVEAARARATKRSTWVSVFVNVLLSAVQVVVGAAVASQALIADGVHSLSDLVADFVVLLAVHHGRKGPDADHQYGHQRYETVASMVLGGLLIAVGLGMAWAAVGKLRAPDTIAAGSWAALWVAVAALVSKEVLFRYMLNIARRVRSSLLVANAWHARSDAASSLVVAVGIGGNLAGVPLLDPLAASVVGLMVLRMGWRFVWEALHVLMDRAASADEVERIRAELGATPGVLGVHDLRTRRMGDMILVDVHLEVDGSLTVTQGHDIALAAQSRVMAAHPVLDVLTHVDPVTVPR